MRPTSPRSPRRNIARLAFACIAFAMFGLAGIQRASAAGFRPNLVINIPTVSIQDIKRSTQLVNGGEVAIVDIPWLANYVSGVYTYAVGLAGLLAAVMFMVGGFQYLTAGGDASRVGAAKKRITDAVIGLALVLGSFVILDTINPDLIAVQSIRIQTVPPNKLQVIPADQIQAVTGGPPVGKSEMVKRAMDKAQTMPGGHDFACFVEGSMKFESGGRPDVLGHDENAATTVFAVGARQSFISSGTFYSKGTFAAVPCSNKSCQGQGPTNDDGRTADVTKPPDYGLDWRYSHGIGSGQSTIFPSSAPCPGRENEGRAFHVAGCRTLPDLLNPDKQIDAMLAHYQLCWGKTSGGTNPAAGYVCYAGTIAPDNPITVARVNEYTACRAGGGGT